MATASAKTVLIAHRLPSVRDRFAAALADARHAYVMAESESGARLAVGDASRPISLALIDLGLAADGVAFVKALRQAAGRPLPVVVFAGTVSTADQVQALLTVNVAGYISEHAATPHILPALAPHLFPDSFNRRASPRVTLGIPISYRSGQTIASSLTLDISKGGVGIRTMSPLPIGAIVQVKFRLPGSGTDVDASGRVTWSDRKVGMGIQFDRVEGGAQAAIDVFIDERR